jgi:hypothetical protein
MANIFIIILLLFISGNLLLTVGFLGLIYSHLKELLHQDERTKWSIYK